MALESAQTISIAIQGLSLMFKVVTKFSKKCVKIGFTKESNQPEIDFYAQFDSMGGLDLIESCQLSPSNKVY